MPRARGGRLGHPQRCVRTGLTCDVRDLALGLRGAEGAVARSDAHGRGDRLLRFDRARRGVRSGHDADARAARRLRLDPERCQDVDHQRLHRRYRHRVGPHGGQRDSRVHRRAGNARVHGTRDPQEALTACLRDLRARPRRRSCTRREHAPRREHTQGAAVMPQRGPVRDRLRCSRRRPGVL